MVKWGAFAAALLSSVGCGREGFDVPKAPSSRVMDNAQVLNPEFRKTLALRLQDYEMSTRHQVWVYIVDRLPPRTTVEAYSIVAFNSWRVGRKGHDDGAVLFLFIKDRQVRIQTGYSLEHHKKLSDRKCARIIELMKPTLRKAEYENAVMIGVDAMLREIGSGEEAQ